MATATVSRSVKSVKSVKSKYKNLDAVISAGLLDLPASSRRRLAIGRGGALRIPRNYILLDGAVTELKVRFDAGDVVPNPFNRSVVFYIFESLKALGVNRNHNLVRVLDKFKELTSVKETKDESDKTFWQRWKNKEQRTENGRDYLGRFEQVLSVNQRLGGFNAPGRKLIDLGTKVLGTAGVTFDIVYGKNGKDVMVRLNTNSDTPVNETKRSGATVEQQAEAVGVVVVDETAETAEFEEAVEEVEEAVAV